MVDYTQGYLDFLKWSLHPSAEIPGCAYNINWHKLLSFANAQAVSGIYWLGVQRLGSMKDNKPTDDDVMEWMAQSLKTKRRNDKIDAALVALADFLRHNDVAFFVFKGQVVARCYPEPSLRSSGDIDFYVFRDDWQRTVKLIAGRVKLKNAGSFRHIEFSDKGVPFEMHYITAEFASRGNQCRWNQIIEQERTKLGAVDVGGTSVPVLEATTNCVYLFIHIYHHFLKEGIGLRQFIDWMYFLERHHADIDTGLLTQMLTSLSLMRAFRAFGTLLTDVLGMSSGCFPYPLDAADRHYQKAIIDIILRYGNFGQHGRNKHVGSGPSVAHSLETGFRSVRHLLRFFWLSPTENLMWLPRLTWNSLMKNLRRIRS